MTSATPTDPRIARSRAKVLDAATAILVEAGPRAVTVDAVAERSGVAKSTLYRHWTSRQDLLVDVMRANVPDVAPPPAELGFEAALRHLVHGLADVLDDPEWRAILPAMVSLQQHLPELADVFHDDQHDKFAILGEVLARGVDEGRVDPDLDAELAAHVLIGPIMFAVLSGRPDLDRIVEFTVEHFLASCG